MYNRTVLNLISLLNLFLVFLPALCTELSIDLITAEESNDPQYNISRNTRQAACPKNEFLCKNGKCIKSFNVCDGKEHCTDSSDETKELCGTFRCPGYTFRCAYGACVDGTAKCNGVRDCADGSDEKPTDCPPVIIDETINQPVTTCSPEQYRCKSGMCIDKYSVCDGSIECDDGSDETAIECSGIRCTANTFRCTYGACITGSFRCDGVKQCADGSDESTLTCSTRIGGGLITVPPVEPSHAPPIPRPVRPTKKPISITTTEGSSTSSQIEPGSCITPADVPGRRYEVICSEDYDAPVCKAQPGEHVRQHTTISVRCDPGYVYKDDRGNMSICVRGAWLPFVPECQKTCKKLKLVNGNLTCIYRGEVVSCDDPIRPETRVQPECLPAYRPQSTPTYGELVCQEDGDWDDVLFKCVPGNFAVPSNAKFEINIYPLVIVNNSTVNLVNSYVANLFRKLSLDWLIPDHETVNMTSFLYNQTVTVNRYRYETVKVKDYVYNRFSYNTSNFNTFVEKRTEAPRRKEADKDVSYNEIPEDVVS